MEKWYFWSNKMFILCIRIFQIFWRWTKMPFEMETLYVLENLIFIIFEMQFLQLFKRLYPQKAFWRRLISGFYLSCQKIILNSTGNLKLFWLIKIGSKISPWLFLSFLRWLMIEKMVWRCPFMTKNRPLFKKTLLLR